MSGKIGGERRGDYLVPSLFAVIAIFAGSLISLPSGEAEGANFFVIIFIFSNVNTKFVNQ